MTEILRKIETTRCLCCDGKGWVYAVPVRGYKPVKDCLVCKGKGEISARHPWVEA